MPVEAQKKLDQIIKTASIEELCKLFEETNNRYEPKIPIVRGWIMDELEKRDPIAFLRWIDTENPNDMDYPSLFF